MVRDSTIEKMISKSFNRIKRSALARKNPKIKKAIDKITALGGIGWIWNTKSLKYLGRAFNPHSPDNNALPCLELTLLYYPLLPRYEQYELISHEVAHLVDMNIGPTPVGYPYHGERWSNIHKAMGGTGVMRSKVTRKVWDKLEKAKRNALRRLAYKRNKRK